MIGVGENTENQYRIGPWKRSFNIVGWVLGPTGIVAGATFFYLFSAPMKNVQFDVNGIPITRIELMSKEHMQAVNQEKKNVQYREMIQKGFKIVAERKQAEQDSLVAMAKKKMKPRAHATEQRVRLKQKH